MIKKAEGVIRLAALDEYSIGSKAIEIKKESQKNPSRIYHWNVLEQMITML